MFHLVFVISLIFVPADDDDGDDDDMGVSVQSD